MLHELLGTKLPLIQAPMAGVQGHELAAAVSNAGGLGSLPAAMLSGDALRAQIAALSASTSAPFNLNFFCHEPPVFDATREAAWRASLAKYYAELGVDAAQIPSAPARASFGTETLRVLHEFRPAVVSFHFGLPASNLLAEVKRTGAKVLSSATTLDEALWLQARGVDAIIAQGMEAGGHRGMFLSSDITTQVGTLALVAQVATAVKVPVIAAGGIADARGVAAAFALGAVGVQVGTAYLLCPEAKTTVLHRAALASTAARHTALTNVFSGRPARGIVNRFVRERGPMHPDAPAFPLAAAAVAPLRVKAEQAGSSDFSPLWSGQNATGCKPIPAAELTRELAAGIPAGQYLS